MKEQRLLRVLGNVKDQYIEELCVPGEAGKTAAGHRPVKRVWLIAAIIAVMVFMLGCAYALMKLEGLKLSDNLYPNAELTESTEQADTISLQGFVGSVNYQAAKEWMEFELSYDPDRKIMQSLTNEEMVMPEEYWSYSCYTPEMTAKVDEICEKYGLVKQGEAAVLYNKEQFFGFLQIDGVIREDAMAEIVIHPQYLYRTGTFMLSCETKLTGEDAPWAYNMEYQFYCVKKTDFDDVLLNVGDIESYEQWEYTTWNGVKVLLALSSEKALLIVDKEDVFITINVLNPRVGDVISGEKMMTREAMEAFADTFDFSFTPQPVSDENWEEVQERLTHREENYQEAMKSIGGESYAGQVQYLLENASRPEMLNYALLDIDGDGTEELLVARRQHICCIYTMEGNMIANLLEYPVGRYIYNYLWEEEGL